MRKYNKVKKLHRSYKHRNAMLHNMMTDLFYHERIKSTTAKTKVVRQLVERLITRARLNLNDDVSLEKKIHNIRIVGRLIKNKEVLNKLFNDIAPRFKERPGGYTRIIKLGPRNSDRAEMAFLELVERKALPLLKEERTKKRAELQQKKQSDTPKKVKLPSSTLASATAEKVK